MISFHQGRSAWNAAHHSPALAKCRIRLPEVGQKLSLGRCSTSEAQEYVAQIEAIDTPNENYYLPKLELVENI